MGKLSSTSYLLPVRAECGWKLQAKLSVANLHPRMSNYRSREQEQVEPQKTARSPTKNIHILSAKLISRGYRERKPFDWSWFLIILRFPFHFWKNKSIVLSKEEEDAQILRCPKISSIFLIISVL